MRPEDVLTYASMHESYLFVEDVRVFRTRYTYTVRVLPPLLLDNSSSNSTSFTVCRLRVQYPACKRKHEVFTLQRVHSSFR